MMTEAEQIRKLCNQADDQNDIIQLFLECLVRIADGKSKNPAEDAQKTINGAGVIAAEALMS